MKDFTSFSSKEITERKAAEMKERRARAPGTPAVGLRSQVEVVVCSTSRFETQQEAARWVREHDFSAARPEATGAGWRFHQRTPADRYVGPTRDIAIDDGVTGVVPDRN